MITVSLCSDYGLSGITGIRIKKIDLGVPMDKEFYFINEACEKFSLKKNEILYYGVKDQLKLYYRLDSFPVKFIKVCEEGINHKEKDVYFTGFGEFHKTEISELYFNRSSETINITTIHPKMDRHFRAGFQLIDPKTPHAIEPRNGSHFINARDIILFHDEIVDLISGDRTNRREPTREFKKLPNELKAAIGVFFEFYNNRPADRGPAQDKIINKFIQDKMGEKVSAAALERIKIIARPESEKKGGSPKLDCKSFLGHSKEKG